MNNRIWILAVAGFSCILDQISKWLVEKTLTFDPPMELIPGFLSLTFVKNYHGAFGMNLGHNTKNALAIASIIVVLLVVLWIWRLKPQRLLLRICFGLILGGALGNLYDRLFRDGVVDFIDVHYRDFSWPTFNLADIWLCVGAILIIWEMLFHSAGKEASPPLDQNTPNP